MTEIDVCIPTKNGSDVVGNSIRALIKSCEMAGVDIHRVLVVNSNKDKKEEMRTMDAILEPCLEHDLGCRTTWADVPLAKARELLIDDINTDWFVFLDDDAIVSENYMSYLWDWTSCERVGAVRGRKERHADRHPTSWLKQRVRRAGVHCLLVRTDAVRDLAYPPDITGVYEDEYMRQYIENQYRFIYEPRALFRHETQGRHPPSWEEGKLAGKYGYEPFYMEALNVPYSIVQWRNPWPYTKRMLGWLYGRYAL